MLEQMSDESYRDANLCGTEVDVQLRQVDDVLEHAAFQCCSFASTL